LAAAGGAKKLTNPHGETPGNGRQYRFFAALHAEDTANAGRAFGVAGGARV